MRPEQISEEISELLDELALFKHAGSRELCRALIAALMKRPCGQIEAIADQFAAVGFDALASMCRTIAAERRLH